MLALANPAPVQKSAKPSGCEDEDLKEQEQARIQVVDKNAGYRCT